MLSNTVQNAINEQIKNEIYSAYLYLSMSAHFWSSTILLGLAHWMRVQSQEELGHALKFYDYVLDRGGKVILQAIDQPPVDWTSPLELFSQVLEHEQKVTGLIHKLNDLAIKENDYATQVMLQWFITEQVEEEKNATQIIDQLKMIEARESGILMLDHRLRKRGESED